MGAVTMFHPPSGRTQRASADAYERVWKAEGWTLVVEPEPPASDDRLADLRAEAQALGLKVHPAAKAETIEKKIAEARAE